MVALPHHLRGHTMALEQKAPGRELEPEKMADGERNVAEKRCLAPLLILCASTDSIPL